MDNWDRMMMERDERITGASNIQRVRRLLAHEAT